MTEVTDYNKLTGPQKAAILIAAIGEAPAAGILRNLPNDDLERITQEVHSLGRISFAVSRQVLEEYHQIASEQHTTTQGGPQTASRLLVKAFGETAAKSLLQRIASNEEMNAGRVESLQKADPKQLARLLEAEHPQTIALILGHLDAKQASALLMHLPRERRADAVRRLANLRQFSPRIAERVSTAVNRRLRSAGEDNKRTYSGFQSVADLMNSIDSESSREILEKIDQHDSTLAVRVRELMFTFDDFLKVDVIQMRELSGAIDKKCLTIALKGASEDLRNHFFQTMSSRAVEMLKEDTEVMGPIRNKDMLKAQMEIVAAARKLEAEGKMILMSDGGDDFV